MVPSLTHYDLPFLQIGPKRTLQHQLREACCHQANVIEDIDKLSSAYDSPIE